MTKHPSKGHALWLSGLPGAGKTTVARALQALLDANGVANVMIDGDDVRPIICGHLGHSAADRRQSLDMYIRLSQLMVQNKVVVILAIINHSAEQRAIARAAHLEDQFSEVWIDTPLKVCRKRDPKGLYQKAQFGSSPGNMVGVDIEYENAEDADVIIRTPEQTPEQAAQQIFVHLKQTVLGTDE